MGLGYNSFVKHLTTPSSAPRGGITRQGVVLTYLLSLVIGSQ